MRGGIPGTPALRGAMGPGRRRNELHTSARGRPSPLGPYKGGTAGPVGVHPPPAPALVQRFDTAVLSARSSLFAASCRSLSLTVLYRSKTLRVLCPVICMATRSGTPALTRLRTAVRRKSWGILPGRPAFLHAVFHRAANSRLISAFDAPAPWRSSMNRSTSAVVTAAARRPPKKGK